MTPELRAALKSAEHHLITESGYAATDAANHRADADRCEKRAEGFRRAAAGIAAMLAKEDQ